MSTPSKNRSYSSEFNPKEFLDMSYASVSGNPYEKGVFGFYRQRLYNFYTRYSCKWNNRTARLLEFGGGPVITSLISAAPHVNEIIFAAYLESERKEVELWKHRKEGAHDWGSHIKYVVNEVEHITGDDAWREREELLRKRITNIIACDILRENPLLAEQEPFDIVFTSLCLEAACTTYAEYKEGVKKLVGLLKPGGFLLMIIVERQTYYVVGKKKWSSVYLTLEQVKVALSEAGTTIFVVEHEPASLEHIQKAVVADGKGFTFLAAQKVEF